MSNYYGHNYKHERKWLEIIKFPKKRKEETPTDKLRKELEESLKLEREIIKNPPTTEDINSIPSTLEELRKSEMKAIDDYEKFLNLIKRISESTGYLEEEIKTITEIQKDEIDHKRRIESIMTKLGI